MNFKPYRKAIITIVGTALTAVGTAYGVPVPPGVGEYIGQLVAGLLGTIVTGAMTYAVKNEQA